jgi:hypothetical protein
VYRHVATFDMDNGFKYLGRPLWRTLGGWLRDLMHGSWSEVVERGRVLMGSSSDPFQIDDNLVALCGPVAQRVVVFVLAAVRGPHDHAVPVSHMRYARRLRDLARTVELGIHPSHRSSVHPDLISTEKKRLEHVTGIAVRCSRQHFLRMQVPTTYRELERLGIAEEHSMGYHERIGFRAGTCTPYDWYDLQEERRTTLVVHPFAVMDNTLRDKLRASPEEAVVRAEALVHAVRAVRGTFTGIWHESFLATTGPHVAWRTAILRILRTARP